MPSPANVSRASSASMSRQLAGCRSACASARTASTPAPKVANRTLADARCDGRGRTRIHASVMQPRIPSEPASTRSGLIPAPDPGRRRDAHTPAGVTARAASRKSSMCVQTVAKWPAARVAIQPPSVEYSKDCG